jgi:hypothetical protein
MAATTRTREIDLTRTGALAAGVMAVSTVAFFGMFNALSTADPRSDTAQFLTDAAARQGLAAVVAWANTWLGILTVPLYLGLYYALRRYSKSYTQFGLFAGVAWGIVLIVATPMMFTLLTYVAPTWASSVDSGTRGEMGNIGATLGWFINTTIGGTVFFLRALSVLAISRVMLLAGERLWTGLGWLGVVFAVEHIVAGVQRVAVLGSGAAAGATVLGAVGGIMLFVWLVGAGVGMWRLHPETQVVAASERVSPIGPASAETLG